MICLPTPALVLRRPPNIPLLRSFCWRPKATRNSRLRRGHRRRGQDVSSGVLKPNDLATAMQMAGMNPTTAEANGRRVRG